MSAHYEYYDCINIQSIYEYVISYLFTIEKLDVFLAFDEYKNTILV